MELNDEARRWVQVLIVKAAQATSFRCSNDPKLVEQYLCETVKAAGNAYGAMLKCGRLGDDFEGSMTRAREACEYADATPTIPCTRCFFPAVERGLCAHHLAMLKSQRAVAS